MMEPILQDHWRYSASYGVRIGLNLAGPTYHTDPVDFLAGDQRSPANLARNPQGLVPSLQIDGLDLTQSRTILEYLDETPNAGWLPPDAGRGAKACALAYAMAMDIHPICNLHTVRHAVALGGITTAAWTQHSIAAGFAGLEGMLTPHPQGCFCLGDMATLADICLVPRFYNVRCMRACA